MTRSGDGTAPERKPPVDQHEGPQAAPWRRRAAIALLLTGALAGGLVAGTFAIDGLAQAMRCATALAMPIGALWLFFFAATAWLAAGRRWAAAAVFAALFVALGVVGNGRFASRLMQQTEWPSEDIAAARTTPLRAIVVLGGGASVRPHDVVELNREGERIFSAAQAWYAGQTKAIICTGTTPGPLEAPSTRSRRLLESVGVPPETIYEVTGVNTTNEMRSLAVFFDDPPADLPVGGEVGLITSAFHMPRAMRLAEGNGLSFVPLPCAYRSGKRQPFSPHDLVPSAGAIESVSSATKEGLAWVVGR